ncbi:MAG TPA: (2Fe-2S)-binding protein [Sphingobium sp.]|nr:(2Fe-2S)-binding protein [Sphingobium sp.]
MLVCICNAISEDELRTIARQGISDPEAAFAALGKRPNCRTCLDHADDVLFAEQRRSASTRAPAPQSPPASFATA